MLKTACKVGSALVVLFLCTSWEDRPDTTHPTDSYFDRDCESEGWSPEGDSCRDTSESSADHEGTCTGVPDRDR